MAAPRLPEEVAQQVVTLRNGHSMPWRDIAKILGISQTGARLAYERTVNPAEYLDIEDKRPEFKTSSNSVNWDEYKGANWTPYLRLISGASQLMGAKK